MNRKGLRHPFLKTAFFVLLWNLVAVYGLRNTTKPPFCPPPCQCIWHFKRSTSQYFATVTCKNVDKVPFPLPPLTTYLYMRSYSDSRITYIPENYFAKLNVLRTIDLSHHLINNRFYIPPTTWILDLSTNNFSGTTLKGMFANLSNLRTLFLDSNPLNGPLLEGTFVGLRNLRKISLSNNGINEIEKGSFDGLTNVSEINLKDNNLRNLTKGVLKGINGDSEKRLRLDLGHNSISWIEEGFFANVTHLRSIDLSQNKLTKFPDLSHINGSFQKLLLADNNISDISNLKKLRMKTIAELSLSNNNITVIDRETFKSISVIMLLDLSYNKIRQLPDNFLAESSKLSELMLHSNFIENITVNTFAGLKGLHGLYISNNRLWKLPDSMFSQMSLQNLFMYNNKFTRLSGRPFKGLTQSELTLLRIYLFSNEITKMEREVLFDLDNSSKLVLDCTTLQELPHTRQYPKAPRIICAPANIGAIPDQREEVARALRRSGFECKRKAANDFDCKICAVGTRGVGLDDMSNSNECINCSAGGFYQDEMGKTDCKKCDVGTFVLPKNAPATSPTLCRACPQGTQSDTYAGFRACRCLPKFSRKDRFGPCEQCSTKGLDCQNDYAILAPGYFWEWNWGQNGTKSRNDYKMFIENLRDENEKALSNYGKKYEFGQYGKFSWSLPLPHKCPRKSCLGGLYSNCSEGYTGPLCAICRPYYYQRFSKCLRCPSRLKASLQITGVVILFVLVVLAIVIGDRKRAGNGRTLADVIISCFKIIVGFYQVMAGVFSSFSNVEWPTAVVWIGKYLRYIELNLVEVAPLGCLYEKFTMNALHEFIIALSVNILVILVIVVYLLIRVSCIRCSKTLSCREIAEKVREVKKSCYRNICLFLFASYPITSAKIIQILPANCQRLCFDVKNQYCTLLLRTDYSVTCNTETHYWYWHIAAGFLVYPIGFPILILLLVMFYVHLPNKKAASADQKMTDVTSHGFVFSARRSESHDEPAIKFGLSLFYENYRPQCWYWETVEMVRKVLLTSVLILIGPHSRTQIGIGAIISASFAIFYAYLRPIKNWFENLLQTIALMAIFLNLAVGVMLKISDENISPNVNVKADGIGVSILLIFINSIIIILVTVCCVRVIGLYLMKWYKKPRPSSCGPAQCMRCCLGCCLSLLVPCSFAGSKDKLEFTDEHHNILTEAEEYAKHH